MKKLIVKSLFLAAVAITQFGQAEEQDHTSERLYLNVGDLYSGLSFK